MPLLEAIGSLRSATNRHSISLCAAMTLISLVSSFTPPRVLYGGWVPILPGHPFYFGSMRHKSYEQHHMQNQPHYQDPGLSYTSYSHSSSVSGHPEYHSSHETGYSQSGSYEPHNHNDHVQPDSHFQGESEGRHKAIDSLKYSNDIHSYFPPQSSYDRPPEHVKLNIEPIYIEVPRKPMDLFENPQNYVPYILPEQSKAYSKELKVINHGGEKAFLKITPLESIPHDTSHQIGQANLDKYRFLPNNNNHPTVDNLMKPYRSAFRNEESSRYSSPLSTQSSFKVIEGSHHVHNEEYENSYPPMNNFRGTNFPEEDTNLSHKDRKFGIKTAFRNSDNLGNQNYIPYSHNNYASNVPKYAGEKFVSVYKSPVKYAIDEKDNFHSSASGNIKNRIKMSPSSEAVTYRPVGAYHMLSSSKPTFALGGHKYNYLAKNAASLAKALKNSLNNYFYKNINVGGMYREPGVLTHIQGTPAVVEREVAIVHVPIQKQSEYLDAIKDYREIDSMHETANIPQFTELRNFKKVKKNETRDSTYGSKPIFLMNDTSSMINFDHSNYGRTKYRPGYESYENIHNRPRHYDSIFVGTDSINANDVQNLAQMYANNNLQFESTHFPKSVTEKKQFFHAYYAPSDHVPPPGYKKMSIKEFEKLFKNAEIQYLRREQSESLRREEKETAKNTK